MNKVRAALLGTTLLASGGVALPALATPFDFDFSSAVTSGFCNGSPCQGNFTITNNTVDWLVSGFEVDLASGTASSASIDSGASSPVSNWVASTPDSQTFQYLSDTQSDDLGSGTFTGFDWSASNPDASVTFDFINTTNSQTGSCQASITGGGDNGVLDGGAAGCDAPIITSAVPEPASLALFGAGLGFLAAMRRRKRR